MPKPMSNLKFWALFILVSNIAYGADAKSDLYDVPKVTAVSHKKYALKDEVTLEGTYLSSDPFVKYIAGGLSYTHLFSDIIAWEVVNGSYTYAFYSGLTNDLITNQGISSSLFDSLQYYATTNIAISPIYTKNLLFNSKMVYSEFSIVAGGGIASFQYAGFQPVIDVGLVLRYFLSPTTSLKFDFRDYVFPSTNVANNLSLTIGYAFAFGSRDSK
jgi:outer membrane beta-barrel protein